MSDVSVESIAQFHQELGALSALGLKFDLGDETDSQALDHRLREFGDAIRSRVQNGESIEQSVEYEPSLPNRYRSSLSSWIKTGDPTVALDSLAAPAHASSKLHETVRLSIHYPLVILILAYAVLIWQCLYTVPKFVALYQQVNHEPDFAVSLMVQCQRWLPVWSVFLPVLGIAAWWWWRSRSERFAARRVPGGHEFLSAAQHAAMATQLSALLQSGASASESLAVIETFSETNLSAAPSLRLRPLLGWAVGVDIDDQQRSGVMQSVAAFYGRLAGDHAKRWRYLAGTIFGVLIGAGIVLAYGATLFLALRNLWIDISNAGGF